MWARPGRYTVGVLGGREVKPAKLRPNFTPGAARAELWAFLKCCPAKRETILVWESRRWAPGPGPPPALP